MRKMTKRILSLVLALCMVMGCVIVTNPTEAKAATPGRAYVTIDRSNISKTSVTISYSGTRCTLYDIYINNVGGFDTAAYTKIADHIAETQYTITGLTASTKYYVLVKGFDASGQSYTGNPDYSSFTTAAHDGLVSEVAVAGNSPSSVLLAINGNTGSYDVYRDGVIGSEYAVFCGTFGAQASIEGLAPGTNYTFHVYAHDYDGAIDAYSSRVSVDTNTQLVAPTNVKLDRFWHWVEKVDVSWDRQDAADGYEYVFMDSKGKELSRQTVSSYSNSASLSVKANNIYKFKVRAYKNGVYTDYCPDILCFEQAFLNKCKVVKDGKKAKLKVSWSKVKGACGYEVYVSTKQSEGYKKVKTLKNNKKTSVTISKLGKKKISSKKKYYVYVVTKVKHNGQINRSGLVYVWKSGSSPTLCWY